MPITAARGPQAVRQAPALRHQAARLIPLAALYAAIELGIVLTAGRFFDWGRAELLLFHAFRPWLLAAAAILTQRYGWRSRLFFYIAALLLAGAAETLLLLALGAPNPWPEALRGLLGGAMLLIVMDPLLEIGRRLFGRNGLVAAGLIIGAALLLSPVMRAYERIVMASHDPGEAGERPALLLMTGLPIIWGEAGPFDPASRPAAAYQALQREFRIRPLDVIAPETLGRDQLMLLAQPRALTPAELVALDGWVRSGGRVLILTDPALSWPSRLPLGDVRRPPAIGLLGPLLDHWGLRLEAVQGAAQGPRQVRSGGAPRRLMLGTAGRFVATKPQCRTAADWLADCRIGRGRALLVADADLMGDGLWVAPVTAGAERHARLADNPIVLADWLDTLNDKPRMRIEAPARWVSTAADRRLAVILALLPLLLAGLAGLALRPR